MGALVGNKQRGELALLRADGRVDRIGLEPVDATAVLGDRETLGGVEIVIGQYEVHIPAGQRKVVRWDGDYRIAYR